MKLDVKTRFELVETRADGGPVLRGVASVFHDGSAGTEYELFPGAVERIRPGAFDRALAEGQDVVALFNHSPDKLLGRTGGETPTLRLFVTDEGLTYEVDLPATPTGNEVRELIARGDLRGSSFAFKPTKKRWVRDGAKEVLLIEDLDLRDVSVVTHPAYTGTSVSTRSEADAALLKAEYEAALHRREAADWVRTLAG